jgi:DNA-directed RNA polymerase
MREEGLWVVQAKSKAATKQVTMKGFHLPDSIRRLTLHTQTNAVDPRAHQAGIVANFIHSLDASHLARTVALFRARGGLCVGAIHDCVMVRPSEAKLMGECLRDAFVEMYEEDPLAQPVRVIETEGDLEGLVTEYDSWYVLAEHAGIEFPKRGTFDITEVRQSAWFFS